MAAQIISFQCTVKNALGHTLGQTVNQNVLSSESTSSGELSRLTNALLNLSAGERKTVALNAKDAYGFYDPSLVIKKLRRDLVGGESLRLGESVKYVQEGGARLFRVIESSADFVTLDGNHPLAGQDLVFEIEVIEARDASPDEVVDMPLSEAPSNFH